MRIISYTILFISIITLGAAQIIAIGYGLYLWGGIELPLSTATWLAFLLWLKILIPALTIFIIGAIVLNP